MSIETIRDVLMTHELSLEKCKPCVRELFSQMRGGSILGERKRHVDEDIPLASNLEDPGQETDKSRVDKRLESRNEGEELDSSIACSRHTRSCGLHHGLKKSQSALLI